MTKVNDKEAKFEDALDRLEKIVGTLQNGNLTLDESLKIFEEGIRLVRICQDKLDVAETKVSMLIKDNSGQISEIPFNIQPEE